ADDDSGGGSTSMVTFTATKSVAYRIQVGSWNGEAEGSVVLGWALKPLNDDFVEAITLGGTSGTAQGTDAGATLETQEPTLGDTIDGTVWYLWKPAAGTASIAIDPISDSSIAVYSGSNLAALSEVSSGSGSGPLAVSFVADGVTTYHVQI